MKRFRERFIKPSWYPDGPRVIEEVPSSICIDGRLRAGVFDKPCRDVNLMDSRMFNGGELRWWGGPRLQEWVGFGLQHREWYFGMIVINLQLLRFASIYALNHSTGESFSHDAPAFGGKGGVLDDLWSGRTWLRKKGFSMEFVHDLDNGRHKVLIDIETKKNKPAVRMDLDLIEDMESFQPLVVSMPIYPKAMLSVSSLRRSRRERP